MPGTIDKQNNFSAGEISPLLYAQAGSEIYRKGLRTCKNWVPTVHGALINRAGTEFCGFCPTPSMSDKDYCKIAGFTMSDGNTYVLVFAPRKIIIFYDGDQLLYSEDIYNTADPPVKIHDQGDPVEISADWTNDFSTITMHFAQAGDTIVVTACNKDATWFNAPRLITYNGPNEWTIAYKEFYSTASAVSGLAFLTAGDAPEEADDSDHKKRPIEYIVTAILQSTGEETPVSSALTTTSGFITLGANHRPARFEWNSYTGAAYYNVYRGTDDVWGFMGSTRDTSWADDGTIEPDYTRPPSRGSLGTSPTKNSCVAYCQQRLVFATNFQTIIASAVGDFIDWDVRYRVQKDHPISVRIGSQYADRIRHFLPMGKGLAILTERAEYTINGVNGQWAPDEMEIPAHSQNGSSWTVPVLADNIGLYVQEAGSRVRDFYFDNNLQSMSGQDLSFLADHLLEGRNIVEMAWQGDPHHVLWCVCDDGSMLSLTYDRARGIVAWAQHETEGAFENICIAKEGKRDRVYFLVRRGVNGSEKLILERMSAREIVATRTGIFLDNSMTFDGRDVDGTVTATIAAGQGWTYGERQTITAYTATPFVSGDVGSYIVLGYGEANETRFKIVSFTSTTVVVVEAQRDVPTDFRGTSHADWAFARQEYAVDVNPWGTANLTALIDGYVSTASASGTTVTLATHAVVGVVGLPYTARAELLEVADARGDIRVRQKNVTRVLVEVARTAGLQAGKAEDDEDEEDLHPLIKREPGQVLTAEPPLRTGLYEVRAKSGWDNGGRVAIVQEDPFPVTLLSVIREVEIAGR